MRILILLTVLATRVTADENPLPKGAMPAPDAKGSGNDPTRSFAAYLGNRPLGMLEDNVIALNEWTAKTMKGKMGDTNITGGHLFLLSLLVMLVITVYFAVTMDDHQSNKTACSARHILTKTESDCLAARARIEAGEGFQKVAKTASVCPTGKDGGDLGYFEPGTMDPQFDRICFNPDISVDQVVGPVKTRFGYHLFKVEFRTGVKEADNDTKKEK
eukprot:TRINITY_DN85861_c0_g1_i1.p1 TRINITY_DN85861_c0_g1~~TRINITY_DN85861_c0_g1_i1.p1  ORF type:complete len:216 (+),score=34.24 TRINITY_DN85861_c0_g1_i1:81-728(+)